MPGAARKDVDFARGAQIGVNQSFVFVEGHLWMVLGDVNQTHGPDPHVPGPDRMVQGSSYVFINGIPVCKEGDKAGCGHPTTGSAFTFVDH
jgi:uncharacterized Zn-binding protein involved in type VI secretion